MIQTLRWLAALTLATPALAADPAPAPSEIVAAAPKTDWVVIPASDLLVMDLAPDARGKPRRVVIQLMPPPFSQGWIANIRKLAAARWWDGLSVNRVQDNYVAQWGDADGEDKARARALPVGLAVVPESEYVTDWRKLDPDGLRPTWYSPEVGSRCRTFSTGGMVGECETFPIDPYADARVRFEGWWLGALRASSENGQGSVWPVHCYGMVGVGRNLSPDTGSGAELYAVIGHAPRHLDRNIALVGRVIEGMENLSSLPRGTGALGFYETPEERTKITSVRLGNEVPALPAYEYLSTESPTFARYADARANRRDPFFIRPAGGADICNIPVPVRRAK
jgi:peptidylprolyl isomerase